METQAISMRNMYEIQYLTFREAFLILLMLHLNVLYPILSVAVGETSLALTLALMIVA